MDPLKHNRGQDLNELGFVSFINLKNEPQEIEALIKREICLSDRNEHSKWFNRIGNEDVGRKSLAIPHSFGKLK